MPWEYDQIAQSDLLSVFEGAMNQFNNSWPVEVFFYHKICLKIHYGRLTLKKSDQMLKIWMFEKNKGRTFSSTNSSA